MRRTTLCVLTLIAVASLTGCASPSKVARSPAQNRATYLGISAAHPTGAPAISGDGLVAAYDMSTLTGDGALRDFATGSHHGRVVGTTSVQGLWGGAKRFERPTDRVHLPSAAEFAIDGPLSIAVWFRLNALGLHQHVIACDDKFALWLTGSDRLRFVDTHGGGVMMKEPLTSGRWYSVAAVFSGTRGDRLTEGNIGLYIDGTRVAADLIGQPRDRPEWNPTRLYENDACSIGFESHQGVADHQVLQFEGEIDEVLVFNRPLTVAEIKVHASSSR